MDFLLRICSMGFFPVENDDPGSDFEDESNPTERWDNADVSILPFILRAQDFEPFEYVDDAQHYDAVSDRVMVKVPESTVLMVLRRPKEQCEHLKRGATEEGDPQYAMFRLFNSFGIVSELDPGTKSGDTDDVSGGLDRHVEVEPSWVSCLEHSQVPCHYHSDGHQNPPTQSVYDSVRISPTNDGVADTGWGAWLKVDTSSCLGISSNQGVHRQSTVVDRTYLPYVVIFGFVTRKRRKRDIGEDGDGVFDHFSAETRHRKAQISLLQTSAVSFYRCGASVDGTVVSAIDVGYESLRSPHDATTSRIDAPGHPALRCIRSVGEIDRVGSVIIRPVEGRIECRKISAKVVGSGLEGYGTASGVLCGGRDEKSRHRRQDAEHEQKIPTTGHDQESGNSDRNTTAWFTEEWRGVVVVLNNFVGRRRKEISYQ